ncbi:hypothetical protein TNCT_200601, partial [Trichonephila clavata]
ENEKTQSILSSEPADKALL